MKKNLTIFIIILFMSLTKGSYTALLEEEKQYINDIFSSSSPLKKKLIIKGELKKNLKSIMGKYYNKIIISYWTIENKSLWILNSIGKYKPITAGFVTEDCLITNAKVLVYREQIGYEIKYPKFTNQLLGAKLRDDLKLVNNIDMENLNFRPLRGAK